MTIQPRGSIVALLAFALSTYAFYLASRPDVSAARGAIRTTAAAPMRVGGVVDAISSEFNTTAANTRRQNPTAPPQVPVVATGKKKVPIASTFEVSGRSELGANAG